MSRSIRLFVTAFFASPIVLATPALATSDRQVWTTAGWNAKLDDHWRLSQEVVGRFSDNRNGLYEIEITSLVGYRVSKKVTLWAGYVHDPLYADGDHTTTEHRAREQVTIDNLAKLGSGTLSARMRLETRWRDGVDGTGWRLRPYVKYSLPVKGKVALNLSNETFFDLNQTSFQGTKGFDRMRNLITISGPLSKHLTGEVGYMNQYTFVRDRDDNSDNIAYFAISLSI
jgi:hypothetical protein